MSRLKGGIEDIVGTTRDTPYDCGAFEISAGSPPAAATSVLLMPF